jgi:RES domain-containing protein
VKLTSKQCQLLDGLTGEARPLSGTFFRSVEFRWMHPDDVMSGAGAAKLGGRFVPTRTIALYGSDSEETLLDEITSRKSRLGGKALIDIDKYPRVIFRIDLKLKRHISFANIFPNKELEKIRRQCLNRNELAPSQSVGLYLKDQGVQAIVYSSVASAGKNVVVFLENTGPGEVILFNRSKVLAQISRLRSVR